MTGFYVKKCHDKVCVQKYYFGDSMNNILSSTSFVRQSSDRDANGSNTRYLMASDLQSTRVFYRNVDEWDPKPKGFRSTDKLFPGPVVWKGSSLRGLTGQYQHPRCPVVCPPGR